MKEITIKINEVEKVFEIPKIKGNKLDEFLEFSEEIQSVKKKSEQLKSFVLFFLKFTDKTLTMESIDEMDIGDILKVSEIISERNPSLFPKGR